MDEVKDQLTIAEREQLQEKIEALEAGVPEMPSRAEARRYKRKVRHDLQAPSQSTASMVNPLNDNAKTHFGAKVVAKRRLRKKMAKESKRRNR